MEIHPLGESHVLDVDQPYPCSDPTGLHLEQTEQVDLADLVLRPTELVGVEVVLDGRGQKALALSEEVFIGQRRLDLLEGLENRRAIGRDRGPRGFGIRCSRPGRRDLTAPLSQPIGRRQSRRAPADTKSARVAGGDSSDQSCFPSASVVQTG